MPGGTPSHVHYSVPLSNLSVAYKPPKLVAETVIPRRKVDDEFGLYYIFDKSSFNIVRDERADGTPENESTGGWFEASYKVQSFGLRDKITRRQRRQADAVLKLDISVNNRLLNQLRTNLEWRVLGPSGLCRTTANLISVDSTTNLSLANSSPRTAIQAQISVIQRNSGQMATQMVTNPDSLRQLTRTAEYRDEVKHVKDIRNLDSPDRLYGLDVIEATGLANLTGSNPVAVQIKTGASAAALNWIFDSGIFIQYTQPSIGEMDLTFASIFFTETYSRKWFDESCEADWIASNDIYSTQLIAKECGALISNPWQGV